MKTKRNEKPKRQTDPRTTISIKNKWLIKADERDQFRHLFDLYEIRDVEETLNVKSNKRKKSGNIIKKEILVGYSYQLHNALDKIVRMETTDALNYETVSLKDYIKELRKQKQEIYDKFKFDK